MFKMVRPLVMALGAALLAACGGNGTATSTYNPSTKPGTATYTPPFRIASVNAVDLAKQLGLTPAGVALLALTGHPVCGIDVYYLKFATVGGAGEATQSSGALMVPNGADPRCRGARPMLEYAHGTWTEQASNIADITDPNNTEGSLIAAMFAAQGYIVVAPNYAGYDISTLGYHPYLDAAQQSGEMIDILTAARAALPHVFAPTVGASISDNGQLFLTGYSQGGHVAMATLRAMQAAGMKVTAAAPMSGPYALEAFTDAVFYGNVDLGSTVFSPLVVNSYQHAYSNVDTAELPVFSASYPDAETLLPSTTPLDTIFATGLLPETALFSSTTPVVSDPPYPVTSPALTCLLSVPPHLLCNPPPPALVPLFQLGFGNPFLVNNDFRVYYVLDAASNPDGALPPLSLPNVPLAVKGKPAFGLRQDVWLNDMRNDVAGDGGPWFPASPTLLCGGENDPTVFFQVNTQTMAAFWSALPPGAVTVLDVDGSPTGGPFDPIQVAFKAQRDAELQGYLDAGLSPEAAAQKMVESYHTDVAPFCTFAARSFFAQF